MTAANLARLFILAAIWGGSFLFMRIGAPILGPVLLIEYRVGLAALFLLIVAIVLRKRLEVGTHWRHYLVIGLFNSALPFLLFAFAAKTLSVSILSILNASSPIWGALISAAWTRQSLPLKTVAGLVLGVIGVVVLVGFDKVTLAPGAGLAIFCTLSASFCYGIATTYTKFARKVEPFSNAHGSMWAAALIIAPAVLFFPATTAPSPSVWLSVLALGVVCSGIAYLLYFRLVEDVGATSALTVTFLVPLFGILWGHLFLGEPVSWQTGFGSAIVILGTALVTGFSPAALVKNRPGPGPSPEA